LREIGPFEVRDGEVGSIEMRVAEVSRFEMRASESSPFEMRPPFKMRAVEVGPFEVRALKSGSLEVRAEEVCSFQNRTAKIEAPIAGTLAFPIALTSAFDHCQNGGDIRCRRFAKFLQFFSFLPEIRS
jgi:hypothetical protein